MDGEQLLTYACKKFELNKYDEALEAFALAYNLGHEKAWILDNVYSCYMLANEKSFQIQYNKYRSTCNVAYEECVLDFIPYKDGEYYIFDKDERMFYRTFSTISAMQAVSSGELKNVEFSPIVVEVEKNWEEAESFLIEAKRRKVYVICKNKKRFASYYKIPELAELMKNIIVFQDLKELQVYFHIHTAEYLPKYFRGTDETGKKFWEIFQEEHTFRLTPEGRNTQNVLLTIGIPTYHRGNLLLKRLENLQQMVYDAEVEFAISKNGMDVYQKEYDQVPEIRDSRINYYDHGKDLKYEINWHYVVEMAHGEFVLFVSDEDDIILDALEHYLEILRSYKRIDLIRAKTSFQYQNITTRRYRERGKEAFKLSFLSQNYLSGLIVKRKVFLESNFLELERYSNNVFYQMYPHEWWCAVLNKKGDYLEENVMLIHEFVSESPTVNLLYATYSSRIEQLWGQIEFLKLFINSEDQDLLEYGWIAIVFKIGYYLKLAYDSGYEIDKYDVYLQKYGKICMNEIMNSSLDVKRKKRTLIFLNQILSKVSD